jgi:DNA-binding NarL/FixJ family response regulator
LVTVSIIEDDKSYREGLQAILEGSEHFQFFYSYGSAEEALPHLVLNPPDIAIVDIKLPGRNGVELIGEMHRVLPDVRCLVCSFYDDDEYVFNALKNGATGYLLKDSLPAEIIAALQELQSGGAPMSRYIARKVINTFRSQPRLQYLSELTDRENEILTMIAEGMIVKQVSARLNLSPHTVTKHLKNIYTKLHVNNRIEAVNRLRS